MFGQCTTDAWVSMLNDIHKERTRRDSSRAIAMQQELWDLMRYTAKPCAWCGGLPPRCCHSEKW